jgi:glycosyltransferase involved in cell wall biosynthesis
LAIAKIKDVIPQIKLIIIGEGPEKKSLQMIIKDKGISDKILFVGFQQNTAKWLANFDCLVLPSAEQESFGLVAAEALATQKPVIITNMSGLREVVADCGYIVEPHHSTNIADALVEIYKNYNAALEKADCGRKRIEENFSQEKMLKNYAQIFENLA